MSFFETKNALFGYFWTRILKTYRHILDQRPRVCLIAKFCAKTKILNCGTKSALVKCFRQQF